MARAVRHTGPPGAMSITPFTPPRLTCLVCGSVQPNRARPVDPLGFGRQATLNIPTKQQITL